MRKTKAKATKTLSFNGSEIVILAEPPPHVLFLGSQLQSEGDDDHLRTLALVGGLAALCVQSIDGEEVIFQGGLPRDLDTLAKAGQGFIMAAFDHLGGTYAELGELFEAVMGAYQGATGAAANPT